MEQISSFMEETKFRLTHSGKMIDEMEATLKSMENQVGQLVATFSMQSEYFSNNIEVNPTEHCKAIIFDDSDGELKEEEDDFMLEVLHEKIMVDDQPNENVIDVLLKENPNIPLEAFLEEKSPDEFIAWMENALENPSLSSFEPLVKDQEEISQEKMVTVVMFPIRKVEKYDVETTVCIATEGYGLEGHGFDRLSLVIHYVHPSIFRIFEPP